MTDKEQLEHMIIVSDIRREQYNGVQKRIIAALSLLRKAQEDIALAMDFLAYQPSDASVGFLDDLNEYLTELNNHILAVKKELSGG